MGQKKTERTNQLINQSQNELLSDAAVNLIEQHNFDQFVRQGVICVEPERKEDG